MALNEFKLKSSFKPKGSQPEAIKKLMKGLKNKLNYQTLLGVTGSGKTFTVANIISQIQKPTLVLAHNKTLAAQLYNEFKDFFPKNRVEYFVSYYDYYQPESYIPQKDQYIEKDAQVNPKIEQMRLAATASLISRKDVIVVASVSCIYSVGDPKNFVQMGFEIVSKKKFSRNDLIRKLVDLQFERNDLELMPGRFRVKGDTIDFIPGYFDNIIRIELFGDIVEKILEIEKTSGNVLEDMKYFHVYPARQFVISPETISSSIDLIKDDLKERLLELEPLEAHRLKQRTLYDLEMIEETGFCKGIENYSRYFEGRKKGERPFCLLDYFPEDFMIVIDESHQTLPQVRGMYKGDYSRKKNLIDYGFRLPSAFDNRPLDFSEFEKFMKKNNVLFVSATPGPYEETHSSQIVEQIIRPTGLVDPVVLIKPIKGQINDLKEEIRLTISRGDRVLVTTLTKKLAEELTEYFAEAGIKTRYLHSEIDTLERTEIIRQLRLGKFDVLVGINLLREGLDIPEVGFIGVLDADKEGFLRDARSLIQIIGRAARNINSKVVLYADKITDSIKKAVLETNRRRNLQLKYNKKNKITPKTIIKPIKEKEIELTDAKHIPKKDVPNLIIELEFEMQKAANKLEFERAIALRDRVKKLKERIDVSKS
ncbi:MAG: excinuclease ABC subunit UvrB [Nanoarchaeota archaeon]|nr:excinuclease ABC subunit UvrB [Nanoarchaeota archaeon]MBU1030060.1 excinuclease ABC subunit UvrB [Nanoarchaeota archaeon]